MVSALNPDSVPEPEAAEAVANMLNSVLDREDLFSVECWGTPQESVDAQSEVNEVSYTIKDQKIEYFLRYKESWDHDDLTVFNRLLVEDRFLFCSFLERGCGFQSFNAYVSRWISDLTDASLNAYSYESSSSHIDIFGKTTTFDQWRFIGPAQKGTPQGYAGYLFFAEPVHMDLSSAGTSMKRMLHPCFGVVQIHRRAAATSPVELWFSSGVSDDRATRPHVAGRTGRHREPGGTLAPVDATQVAKMLIDHANSGRHTRSRPIAIC